MCNAAVAAPTVAAAIEKGKALARDARASAPPKYPSISNNFVVSTSEVDDTTHSVIVTQTIVHNNNRNRSRMVADGDMVRGHLEQQVRLDVEAAARAAEAKQRAQAELDALRSSDV